MKIRAVAMFSRGSDTLDEHGEESYNNSTSPVATAAGCEVAERRPLRVLDEAEAPSLPVVRANIYIDGFNLYHGCFDDPNGGRASWRKYRWLDLSVFCAKIFPNYQIDRIRYFTALVNPTPTNPDCRVRQLQYIRALETIPTLTVHRGRFATNVKKRKRADRTAKRPTPAMPIDEVYVIEDEEKGSDVNLASYLLLDGFRGEYDSAVIVSNDSDLVTPIQMVRSELGLRLDLLNPRKKCAADLLGKANSYRYVREGVLRDSQFPPTLTDAHGTISKPATW